MKRGLLTILLTVTSYLANSQVVLSITSPSNLAGNYAITYADPAGAWGVPDPLDPLNALIDTLMLVDDGTASDSLGCNALVNDLTGKIAVVYRGTCQFGTKALMAQNAGAVAVIIINNITGAPVGMNGGTDGPNVTIPVIMISQIDGSIIRNDLDNGADIVAFIGTKSGLFDTDLSLRDSRMLFPTPMAEYSLLAKNDSEYSFRVGSWVYNDGKLDQVASSFKAEISYGGNVLYSEIEPSFSVPTGDSIYLEFPVFISSSYPSGKYTLTYTLTSDSPDDYDSDNSKVIDFNVSDLVYSYVKLNAAGLPNSTTAYRTSAATSTFSSCIHFRDANAARTKVEGLYFAATTNTSAQLNGQEFNINAYKWNDVFVDLNDPAAAIANLEEIANGTYLFSADSMDFRTVYAPFTLPITMVNDQRYLFCVTTYDPNTYIGYGDVDHSWVIDTVLQPLFPIQTDAGYNIVGFGGEPSSIGLKMSSSTPQPVITAAGYTNLCAGETLTLTSSADNGNLWSTGEGTKSIVVSQSGTYTSTVGGLVSNTINVVVNAYPATPSISSSTAALCPGGDVTLTSSSNSGNTWSNGASTNTITVSSAGTYSLSVSNNGCISSSAPITVSAFVPATITSSNATTFCAGNNTVLTSSYATGNTWSTGETTQSIVVNSSQVTSLMVASMGCNAAASNTITTVVNPTPVYSTGAIVAPTACTVADATVDLAGTETGDLSWTGPVSGNMTGVTLPITLNSLSAGTYVANLTNATGCNTTISFSIADPGAPVAPVITASGATTICSGATIDLTSDVSSDILWSTGETTATITVNAAGNYSVATGILGGCLSSSAATMINVNTLPTVLAGSDMTVCNGEMVTLMGSGATNYSWDNSITNGTAFAASATTTYTVTGTDVNGCSNTATVIVTVNATPTVNAGADKAACVGGTVTLSGAGATTYTWDGGVIDGQAFVAFNTQDYMVTGTDANGCSASDVIRLTVNPLPNVTYVETLDTICYNYNPATLSPGSPALGVYSGNGVSSGASGATFNPAGLTYPSNYSIVYTATDINGCIGSAAQSIYVDACAGINNLVANNIKVYPNPANAEFQISSDNLMKYQTVELTDQLGRVIQTWNINKNFLALNISQVAAGNYNLVFKGINGKTVQQVQITH